MEFVAFETGMFSITLLGALMKKLLNKDATTKGSSSIVLLCMIFIFVDLAFTIDTYHFPDYFWGIVETEYLILVIFFFRSINCFLMVFFSLVICCRQFRFGNLELIKIFQFQTRIYYFGSNPFFFFFNFVWAEVSDWVERNYILQWILRLT